MRVIFHCFLFLGIVIPTRLFSQSLIINEVSQGPTGSKEYVELLVIPGVNYNPCVAGTNCLDLKNWIIDDNNGYFSNGPSTGEGVAGGCIRFANNSFWTCIPVGTLIVIYNDADLNASMPAQDLSMVDNNCRLVIPISSTLFDKHVTSPSTGTGQLYPMSGYSAGGAWSNMGMANTDDSFQIYSSGNYTVPVHGVSWGNNNSATIIYFTGPATNSVYSFTNNFSNSAIVQANWTVGNCTAPNNQTPGLANNAGNQAYISSLTNNCIAIQPIQANLNLTAPAICGCNASASAAPTGGSAYSYVWMNSAQVPIGQTNATANNLCSGWYFCQITSANGCVIIDSIQIPNSVPIAEPLFANIGALCQNSVAPLLSNISTNGISGTWSPPLISTNIIGNTTFQFTPNAGQCADTASLIVYILNGAPAIFNIDSSYCVFASPSLLPTSSVNGISGTWNPATISTGSASQTNYTFTPLAGQCAIGTTISIDVLDSIPPSFFYFSTYCINEVPLVLEPQSTNFYNGTWNPNSINTSTQGVSYYTFTPFDQANNCVTSLTLNIVITDSIVPLFNQMGPYCVGDVAPAMLTQSNQGISGSWYPSPINTSIAGTYSFIFTSIQMACTTIGTMDIVIASSIVVDAGNDTTVCSGSPLLLTGSGATTYSWSNGIQDSIIFIANTTTNYTVTGNSGSCQDTDDVLITVIPTPSASASGNIIGNSAQFTNATTNGTNYFWDFGDGNTTTSGTLAGINHTYTAPGTYQVQLIANNNGCLDTTYISITIQPVVPPMPIVPLSVEIPNFFTPNGDNDNQLYHLLLEGDSTFTAVILNRWGEQVKELNEQNPSWDGTFRDKNCPEGVYFIIYKVIGINQTTKEGHGFLHLIR
jgi:gliding motility-associated-like protein